MLSLLQPHLWVQEVGLTIFVAGRVGVLVAGGLHLPKTLWVEVTRQRYAHLGYSGLRVISSPLEQFRDAKLARAFRIDVFRALFLGLSRLGRFALLSAVLLFGFGSLSVTVIPSRWLVVSERIKARLFRLVRGQLKGKGLEIAPFFIAIFILVLILNLVGRLPFTQTVTASLAVRLGLSFFVWFWVLFLSLNNLGIDFFAHFIPEGTPFVLFPLLLIIELVRFCVRALSLGVRLFANMVAGHTLLAILGGFLLNGILYAGRRWLVVTISVPFAFFVCFAALEVGVAFIQAYVFTVLSLGYIRDALLQ